MMNERLNMLEHYDEVLTHRVVKRLLSRDRTL